MQKFFNYEFEYLGIDNVKSPMIL